MEQELITLGILFACALVGGIIAARFKQPALIGLLLAGAVIGPHALGWINNENIMSIMIEFGAILMLFIIGLEFNIEKLKKIGLKAIVIACLNSGVLMFGGFIVSLLLGLSVEASLFIGVILAFGSTVVIVKVLENKGMMNREDVPLLIAVLIIEDIIAVMVITFFSGIQNESTGLLGNIQSLSISICILILSYLVFIKFIKPLLVWISKENESEEILAFTALAMCAGFAYFAYSLNLSPAVGAFMAGSIIASLPNVKHLQKTIEPYNLIISSFFFIAIGTLVNFATIQKNIMIILILVLTVFLIKIFAFSGIVYFFANMRGNRLFFSSIAMFSVGEFSLLVAKESLKFNIGIDLVSISAAIVAISAILMSFMLNFSDKIYEPAKDRMPLKFRKSMENFGHFIKSVSEELDLDNKYSKGLKSNVFSVLLFILMALLLIFGWREGSGIMEYYGISTIIMWLSYMAVLGILSIFIFYIIFRTQKVLKSLTEIFANATNSKSVIESRTIVKRAFLGFGLLNLALVFPFMMFLFHLKPNIIWIACGLLLLAGWQFRKISQTISGGYRDSSKHSFPTYKKVSSFSSSSFSPSTTKNINHGWKF